MRKWHAEACGLRSHPEGRQEWGVDVSGAGTEWGRCVRGRDRCVRGLTCLGEKGLDFRNGGLRLYLRENKVISPEGARPRIGEGLQVQAGQDKLADFMGYIGLPPPLRTQRPPRLPAPHGSQLLTLTQWFSTFLKWPPFITIPHGVLTPTIKLSHCYVIPVILLL